MKKILILTFLILFTQSVFAEGNYGGGLATFIFYAAIAFSAVILLVGGGISLATEKSTHWPYIFMIALGVPFIIYVLFFGS